MLLAALFGTVFAAGANGSAAPPHGKPEILHVDISERVVHSFDTVSGSVTTSPNVGYVEARITHYAVALHRDGVGRFSLAYRVPWIPFWLHRGYTLQIIARSVDGIEVKELLPIQLR